MSASEFCSIESNLSSYYCKVYEVIGKLPPQYDFVYGIATIIMFVMFLIAIYGLISIFSRLGGQN